MKLKNKVSLLAGAIALVGAMYMPQASATVVTTYTLPPHSPLDLGDSSAASAKISAGWTSFQDFYDFSVTSAFSLVASGNSALNLSLNQGVILTSFNLYDGDHTTILSTGSITSATAGSSTSFTSSFSAPSLLANHTYSIEVNGTTLGNGGSYAFAVSTTAPVPEPEEWAMMLVGAGLVGYQVRRKQKGLSQSSLA